MELMMQFDAKHNVMPMFRLGLLASAGLAFAGTALAADDACPHRGDLDAIYCDADNDMVADPPPAPAATAAPSSSAGTAAEQAAHPTAGPILPSGPALPTSTTTYSYQYVDTPSKNISCILSNEGVGCSILERNYASSGMQDCPDREFSIVALAGRTEVRCGEEYLGQPGDTFHTLEYGETTTFSDYACTSQSKGMTCWNTITGRGFTISRKSLIRF